jgi:hypothetical protein
MAAIARCQVKIGVQDPVKNEHQLNLLQKMDLFMANQFYLIFCKLADPDEDEKR